MGDSGALTPPHVRGVGRPTVAWVNLNAIRKNVETIRSHLGPAVQIMAVVKADGYGHGAVPVARAALEAGADRLGVALAEEGATLRAAGIDAPILVMGVTAPGQIDLVVQERLEAVVFDAGTARWLSERARGSGLRVPVHLKIDTGMTRLGLPTSDEAADLASAITGLAGLELAGLMSHLADADHEDPSFTERQYARFLEALHAIRRRGIEVPYRHLANSAGLFRFPGLQMDMVRSGLALYGLSPYPGAPPLEPALSLTTEVVAMREAPAGVGVGYGHTFVTERPTRLAVVPVGYADGFRRGLSNQGAVLVGGRRVRVAGRVSMDQTVLALGPDVDAQVGDDVVLLGRQGDEVITAEDWAGWLGTISYEVVTGLGARIPRRYRGG